MMLPPLRTQVARPHLHRAHQARLLRSESPGWPSTTTSCDVCARPLRPILTCLDCTMPVRAIVYDFGPAA